jgi:PAS domain S-box-containing protein
MKGKESLSRVASDISILYELSLAVGQSLDLKSNCDRFLKTLMARKNLGYTSVWIKKEHLVDLGDKESIREDDKNSIFLVYANPQFRTREKSLSLHHAILSVLNEKEAFSVASIENGFSKMITEKDVDRGAFAIFRLGSFGFLKFLSMVRESPFREEELNQLKNVISKFTISIEGCFAYQKMIREIAVRNQTEEALLKSEEEAKRLAQENVIMAEIGRIISSTLNIEEVYERFAEKVCELIPFDRIAINNIDSRDNTITISYSTGLDVPERLKATAIPLVGTPAGEVVRSRTKMLIQTEDVKKVTDRFPWFLSAFQAGIRSLMAIPLISKDEVIGVLQFQSTKPNAYGEKDLRLAERVGNQIAGAITNAQLFAEHRRTEEALRESERKFRDLYDNAPLGYHEYDKEGRITNVNQTDLVMLGYTAAEMIGQPIWKLNVGEDIVREQVLAKLAGTLPAGKELERIYRRKDGTTFPVLIEDRYILDEKGQIKGIRCTIQDITERKRAEDKLKQREEDLARSNKELEQFAYAASHDLQEPLRMVKSYVQLLARRYKGKLTSEADEFIEFALDGATRMQRLINDLLTYSRVGTRGKKFELTNCEKILEQVLSNLEVLIEEDNAVVNFDPLPTLMADQVQLGQLFQNLIVNAIKFHGSEAPRVRISAKQENDEWVFSISDNGIGIALEHTDRIFIIFQRLHSREEYPGTGIGLAICKKIVERHGGHIWVESEPGKGATFYFTIPTKGDQQA